MKTTFDLKARYGSFSGCTIRVGYYPQSQPGDPDQIGWSVLSADGEPLGTPTVNLWVDRYFPDNGCVLIRVTNEYEGWLESLIAAGLVEPTGREFPAGMVERYAVECRVLDPTLLEAG